LTGWQARKPRVKKEKAGKREPIGILGSVGKGGGERNRVVHWETDESGKEKGVMIIFWLMFVVDR